MACDSAAVLPGGASTDFLVEEHLDVAMDVGSVAKAGSRLGTGTMIVLDDQTCPVGMLWNLEHFFAQESCGWCTPCREGLPYTEKMLWAFEEGKAKAEDLDVLSKHVEVSRPRPDVLRPGARRDGAARQRASNISARTSSSTSTKKGCPWRT